ncbi:hypothetical protein AXF42_Ash017588 [Apostasia shenzhenica]|uniref:Uncharacterized protein n=1 Tax=Apostasia shenzhenica TaxID=1088818 RepID=A0A2I0A590_9ASPA|nr:hypothetical protein AXF42_Ash017588 [Apostasia shenzhenica]
MILRLLSLLTYSIGKSFRPNVEFFMLTVVLKEFPQYFAFWHQMLVEKRVCGSIVFEGTAHVRLYQHEVIGKHPTTYGVWL